VLQSLADLNCIAGRSGFNIMVPVRPVLQSLGVGL
jgi:hypothetical protein